MVIPGQVRVVWAIPGQPTYKSGNFPTSSLPLADYVSMPVTTQQPLRWTMFSILLYASDALYLTNCSLDSSDLVHVDLPLLSSVRTATLFN
jgi:hypothetical protein